jgi:hypothetical protein
MLWKCGDLELLQPRPVRVPAQPRPVLAQLQPVRVLQRLPVPARVPALQQRPHYSVDK